MAEEEQKIGGWSTPGFLESKTFPQKRVPHASFFSIEGWVPTHDEATRS
jgi:hypothetical protein